MVTADPSVVPARALVAAIDQGTTSTRCLIVDDEAGVVASAQLEHAQSYPQPGWVEPRPSSPRR